MALFPTVPVPSSISAPTIIDPALESPTDAGYMFRRPRYSRPRRRFTMDYLGVGTSEMRIIREFLEDHRLSAIPFEWFYMTGYDAAQVFNTTPVTIRFWHEMRTGQQIFLSNPTTNLSPGIYTVTRVNSTDLTLDGTFVGGDGWCTVQIWIPFAVGVFNEGVMEAPQKHIGPYAVDFVGTNPTMGLRGKWSFSVTVEELF